MPLTNVKTTEERTRIVRLKLRKLMEGQRCVSCELLAESLHTTPAILEEIASGQRELYWSMVLDLWREWNVSPAWLAGDSDTNQLPIYGFEFLTWYLATDRPFVEHYQSTLHQVFDSKGRRDQCAFALFRAMDLAKMSYTISTMPPHQEAALRDALGTFVTIYGAKVTK